MNLPFGCDSDGVRPDIIISEYRAYALVGVSGALGDLFDFSLLRFSRFGVLGLIMMKAVYLKRRRETGRAFGCCRKAREMQK